MPNYKARINQDANLKTKVKGNPLPLFAMPTTFGIAKLSEPLSPMGL